MAVARREAGEGELQQEVLRERGLGGGELGEVVALVVVAPRVAAAGGGVLLAEAVVLGERGRLVAGFLGGCGRLTAFGGRAIERLRGGAFLVGREIGALQQRILGEVALEFLVQLDRGQLQQADRLLQLRSQREVLR